jgi:hypothetical protein
MGNQKSSRSVNLAGNGRYLVRSSHSSLESPPAASAE